MIKISYNAEPFYTDFGMNEPCKKDLEVTFDEDCSSAEVIAEMLKVLRYAGYGEFTATYLEDLIEELIWDGVIKDNREPEEKEEFEILDFEDEENANEKLLTTEEVKNTIDAALTIASYLFED